MKKAIIGSLVLGMVVAAIALSQGTQRQDQKHMQIATPGGSNVGFAADSIQRMDQIMLLKGNVEIRTHDMVLHANEVIYKEKTAEIESVGAVRMKLETQN